MRRDGVRLRSYNADSVNADISVKSICATCSTISAKGGIVGISLMVKLDKICFNLGQLRYRFF